MSRSPAVAAPARSSSSRRGTRTITCGRSPWPPTPTFHTSSGKPSLDLPGSSADDAAVKAAEVARWSKRTTVPIRCVSRTLRDMSEPPRHEWQLACPVPIDDHATVQLAHGGGGRLMRNLIQGLFLAAFATVATPPLVADVAGDAVGADALTLALSRRERGPPPSPEGRGNQQSPRHCRLSSPRRGRLAGLRLAAGVYDR